MPKPEHKTPHCSEKLHEEIETLFKLAPPKNMKRSLMEVYTVYLQHLDNMDFKEVAMDIYFLNKLLEKAEEASPLPPFPSEQNHPHKGD
jgi:hypothetical protein